MNSPDKEFFNVDGSFLVGFHVVEDDEEAGGGEDVAEVGADDLAVEVVELRQRQVQGQGYDQEELTDDS